MPAARTTTGGQPLPSRRGDIHAELRESIDQRLDRTLAHRLGAIDDERAGAECDGGGQEPGGGPRAADVERG